MYKKLLVLASTKLVARLQASDFPSENPRPQTRNFPYTNTNKKIALLLCASISFFTLQAQDIDTDLLQHYQWNGDHDDQTTNEYHGTPTGTSFVEDRFGNPAKACYFNGSTDFIVRVH